MDRIGVLLAQLGTPDAPTPEALRRYLRQFLSDPRVVERNRVLWWFILRLLVLPRRSRHSAALYRRVWTPEGSPLLVISRAQAQGLDAALNRERPGRFKVVNCGWPESLLEEHLFHALRPGSSGTLFLEEVGRLSRNLQDRLLETLDDTVDPRGQRPPRARLMACTSEALFQRALEGSFNERLLYRLNVIHLVVPPDPEEW